MLQYNDAHENEIIVNIDPDVFKEMLQNHDGISLAVVFRDKMRIVERDPRQNELDQCDMWFSDNDVRCGDQTAAELLNDLNEALEL